jgi:phosphomannomutase
MGESTANELSLADCFQHQPSELKFGTSGRRGLVTDLTQLEVYINARAEVEYLLSIPAADGGIRAGDEFYFAYDLRPSSTRFVAQWQGRGEIAQAVEQAIRDAGMVPVNLGCLPTPALMFHAVGRRKGSMMITGSHIPFDRNGYKTNTACGELLKHHEQPIADVVRKVRESICRQAFSASLFDAHGAFKSGHRELPLESNEARQAYSNRYLYFWPDQPLRGMRLLFYQHSAVGRDLVPQILERLGAEVICAGRSEEFVPIDTENMEAAQLGLIQSLVDQATAAYGLIDAAVSTDGDSDRPLILGIDRETSQVRFYSGDLVGMVVAESLGADAAVVPISCNDAIDRSSLAAVLEPKTRIGSPYVIAGMEAASERGKRIVCGWEANGGFLLGSDIERNEKKLSALPTRDAVLPIVAVLVSAREKKLSLNELFALLPRRFSRAALMKNFPKAIGAEIIRRLSPSNREAREIRFDDANPLLLDGREQQPLADTDRAEVEEIRARLSRLFVPSKGFAEIAGLNYIDGVRVIFNSGEVAQLRPSGNADEFRVYGFADSAERADAIVAACLEEPEGILRRLEKQVLAGD